MNEEQDPVVLLLMPVGRDAAIARDVLENAGLKAVVCTSMDELVGMAAESSGAIIAEEALSHQSLHQLVQTMSAQPIWSSLPILLLTTRRTRRFYHERFSLVGAAIGDVKVLQRPLRAQSLVDAAMAAAQTRRRQFLLREFLTAQTLGQAVLSREVALFEATVRDMPAAVWVAHDRGCTRLTGSRVANRLEALALGKVPRRDTTADGCSGNFHKILKKSLVPPALLPLRLAAGDGDEVRDYEERVQLPGDVVRSYFGHASPIRGPDNEVSGAVAVLLDVTKFKQSEEHMEFQAELLDSIPTSVIATDLDGRIHYFSPAASRLYGYGCEEAVGKLRALLSGYPVPEFNIDKLAAGNETEIWRGRTEQHKKDGSRFVADTDISLIRNRSGKPIGFVFIDREAEAPPRESERELSLVKEFDHRTKNILAVVQSIASQTIRTSDGLAEFERVFTGRINALGRVYALLAQAGWKAIGLRELARHACEPFQFTWSRNIRINGPNIMLLPGAALGLNTVLHELATNASRYGALASSSGVVRLSWFVTTTKHGLALSLHWTEAGGAAPIKESQLGFGMQLAEFTVRHEFRGRFRIRPSRHGLSCLITLPWTDRLGWLSSEKSLPEPKTVQHGGGLSLDGLSTKFQSRTP